MLFFKSAKEAQNISESVKRTRKIFESKCAALVKKERERYIFLQKIKDGINFFVSNGIPLSGAMNIFKDLRYSLLFFVQKASFVDSLYFRANE